MERMDDKAKFFQDIVQLARLALAGRQQDIQLHVRRMAKRYRETMPDLSEALGVLLRESPTRASPLRGEAATPVPVDFDSRLQLVRSEFITELPVEPIYREGTRQCLDQIAAERIDIAKLERAGLEPTRSALLVGSPGVGKTLAAKWLASRLKLPLLILDLAAVMSSFLGRTGSNVRSVLDYAKSHRCILLLDEFDAIAKRRDDTTEVGELKRLVTVLLQEIDDWPASGLLLAATNHTELLDPAVWRRFDMIIEFFPPNADEVRRAVADFLGLPPPTLGADMLSALAFALEGSSFSDIERCLLRARRAAALTDHPLEHYLIELMRQRMESIPRAARERIALRLVQSNALSQRRAHELTGVSRDTIRKRASSHPVIEEDINA